MLHHVRVGLASAPKRQRTRMMDIDAGKVDEEKVEKDGAKETLEKRRARGSCFFALLH